MITFFLRVLAQIGKGYIKPLHILSKNGQKYYPVSFRCWPIDIDAFLHLNNASYLRVAELARWRVLAQEDLYNIAIKEGVMFLAVEQNIAYYKPIQPFQRYEVRTSMTVEDNKWIYYHHDFVQHSQDRSTTNSDDADNYSDSYQEPLIYARLVCKAVVKRRSGETFKVNDLLLISPFYRTMIGDIAPTVGGTDR